MIIESDDELQSLKEIGAICRDVLRLTGEKVRPGITTLELDDFAGRLLASRGARSAPKLAYDFPGHTCISVGSVVAHGIPGDKPLVEGQLVNIDVSAEKNSFFGDCGASFAVGEVSQEARKLLEVTKEAQRKGMYAAKAGEPICAIGRVVEKVAKSNGFRQVAGLHSHGVGRWIHEEPDVPTIYYPSARRRLKHGEVITVEPFLATKSNAYVEARDGWSLVLKNGGIGAQFEHSFVVTDSGPIILTA